MHIIMVWLDYSLYAEKDMFGDSFIVPTHFDFNVLSEYKNILLKKCYMRNDYNNIYIFWSC